MNTQLLSLLLNVYVNGDSVRKVASKAIRVIHLMIYPFDFKSEWWFYFHWGRIHFWHDWCLNPHIHPHDLEPGLLYFDGVYKEYFQDCCIDLRPLLWNQPIICIYQTNRHIRTALMVNLARSGWFLYTQERFPSYEMPIIKLRQWLQSSRKDFLSTGPQTNFTSPQYSLLGNFY